MPGFAPSMAELFGNTGGGTAPSGGNVGNTSYAQISPMNDPAFAALFNTTQSLIPQSLPGIDQLISQGMNSPLLQLILGPALQRLQAPQAQQRQNLTESTRAAGGLRGSTYGKDMNTLQNNQALQSNDLMGQVIQQVLGTLVNGQLQSQQNSMLPGKSFTDLLRSIAPSTVTGSNVPPGGANGGLSDPYGMLSAGQSSPAVGNGPGTTNPYSPFYKGDAFTGGAATGVNSGGGGAPSAPAPSAIPYLDPFVGGGGGGSYNIGAGQQYLYSPSIPQPQPQNQPLEFVQSGGWW